MRFLAALALFVAAVACTDPLGPTDLTKLPDLASYTTPPAGKLLGQPQWPEDRWGTPPMTLVVETVAGKEVADRLRLAKAKNQPVMIGMRRRLMTRSGDIKEPFYLPAAKASVDAWARGPLKPDSVRKYAPYIKAWYLIDEPFCGDCWGGRAASAADIKEFARYFRQRIDPGHLIPMAIRVPPSLLDDYGSWPDVDVAWVVYKSKMKLTVQQLLDKEAAIAKQHGWKLVAGVNATHCYESGGGPPCTGTELKRYLEPIIRHPMVCASSSWDWRQENWTAGVRDAWTYLANVAKTQPNTNCA